MFRQTEFLSGEECGQVLATLESLRNHWFRRHTAAPFYTLGAASYLDASDAAARRKYDERAQHDNPLLAGHFGWLYERLAAVLGEVLAGPCGYHPRFGRPGFHIFLPDPAFQQSFASAHVDLQYELLDWPSRPLPDFEHPVSFTGSIVLPAAGAGIYLWDVQYVHRWGRLRKAAVRAAHAVGYRRHPPGAFRVGHRRGTRPIDDLPALTREIAPTLHRYRAGGLVIHSGHTLHQIAPMPPGDGEPRARITLQGHAIRAGGTWWLYW